MPKKVTHKKASRSNVATTVHELEITLLEVQPRIWRRFSVASHIALAKLHDVVQVVMGWTDSHLHQFVTQDETRYATPSPYGDPDWDERVTNSATVRVRDVLPVKGAQLLYQYDFGDGWEHLIKVADIRPLPPSTKPSHCLAGERQCPPEDCGGPYNYPEFLTALADPKHPEHQDLTEWIGGEFDAEAFDLDEVNEILAELH